MNKVSQLLIAPDGYTCTGVTGRLKVKYPRSEFSKGNKGGSVQRCVFQDIENTEIKVCFWNIPEVPYAEEDWICIMPTQGKNGSVGLTVKDNEYKGNVTKELHVSEKASVATSEEPEGNEEVEEVALQSQDSGEEEIISTSDQDTDEDTTSLPVALVQNMNLTNLDVAQFAMYVDIDGMEPEDAASKWLADNADRVNAWVG